MCSLYKVVDGVVDVDVGAVETRVVAKEGAAPAAGMAMRQQMWGAGYGNEFETQPKNRRRRRARGLSAANRPRAI